MRGKSLLILGLGLGLVAASMVAWTARPAPPTNPPQARAPDASDDERKERLRSLGYVDFAERADQGRGGVVMREPGSQPGYNLYTNTFFCSAVLMDERGRTRNFWQDAGNCERWVNSKLLPSGDMLALGRDMPTAGAEMFTNFYVMRLSWTGQKVWKRYVPIHHDINQVPSGDLIALITRVRSEEGGQPGRRFKDNGIAILTADGTVKATQSLYDLFRASGSVVEPWEFKLSPSKTADPFHANSVEWMRPNARSGTHSLYGPSNVLVSIRHQDRVVIVDWDQKRIVWSWGRGELQGPHDATMLPNGNILLMDNGLVRGSSRVVELDPVARRVVWQFPAPGGKAFFTARRGSDQRLPNGNTLICESDEGRAFEVTPQGRMVWEFKNPLTDSRGHRAVMVRLDRFEPSFIDGVIARRGAGTTVIPADLRYRKKSVGEEY